MNEEYRLQTSGWSQDLYNEATKLSSTSSQNEFLKPYGLHFIKVSNYYFFKYVKKLLIIHSECFLNH